MSIKTENIEKFREEINKCALEKLDDNVLVPTVSIDAVIKPTYITLETVDEINRLQPFGVENPTPTFAVRNIKIHKISTMSEKKHLRMTLLKEGKFLDAVGFGMGEYFNYLKEGDFVEVAFGLDINDYKGYKNAQLILKDIKLMETE